MYKNEDLLQNLLDNLKEHFQINITINDEHKVYVLMVNDKIFRVVDTIEECVSILETIYYYTKALRGE